MKKIIILTLLALILSSCPSNYTKGFFVTRTDNGVLLIQMASNDDENMNMFSNTFPDYSISHTERGDSIWVTYVAVKEESD